jgi:hypothetical protein
MVVLIMFLASTAIAQVCTSDVGKIGCWQTLPSASNMPVNPVHAALMHTGKLLIIEGKQTKQGAIWDPATKTASTIGVSYTMFCNAMVVLPDGQPFILGGTLQFSPVFTGINQCSAYDPINNVFHDKSPMKEGRWYPTGIVLSDGTVMAFSGDDGTPDDNNTVEIFTPDPTGGLGKWSPQVAETWKAPLYPRLHLLPDGRVFYSMSDATLTSRFYDLSTKTWTDCCHTVYQGIRKYGTSVLLPLSPTGNYAPKVIIMGGGPGDTTSHSTKTTETIDLSTGVIPKWSAGPDMSQPRIELNATILPSGRVLVTGGSDVNEDLNSVSFNADLYDPVTNTFSSAGMNAVPRLYHSNALLLPDATVLVFGNNHPAITPPSYEPRVELYQPAYLFNADGSHAVQPVINSVPPGPIGYNAVFQVTTPDPSSISSVLLVRPAGVTHAFNMEQRLVTLSFKVSTSRTGALDVTAPPNGNIAPPGYYLLFILNSSSGLTSTGVPSVAKFVQLCPASGCL